MNKAQDDHREALQKQRFGLRRHHARDRPFDAYHKMPIEFKTKATTKGCTTKRRYKDGCFNNCVLIVTDYLDKSTLAQYDYIVFPPALEEWKTEQARKLNEDNGTIPCHLEVQKIREALRANINSELRSILGKFDDQVHRNDPAIPKSFFDSCGQYTSINKKKTKVKHSQWFFKVGPEDDKPKFLRDKIDEYQEWMKESEE